MCFLECSSSFVPHDFTKDGQLKKTALHLKTHFCTFVSFMDGHQLLALSSLLYLLYLAPFTQVFQFTMGRITVFSSNDVNSKLALRELERRQLPYTEISLPSFSRRRRRRSLATGSSFV
jgi:hypothetical protein